ncbi:pregnancy-specific beta-1-glycoprotein 11-like [Crotalus adamanteus]|uniref:Pregnancy-specific beta-1-glycoprotein 11-like n=1 Tax=Crotalus adamanteus TaxID=8729 RepID=A0AAW1AXE9_CROAD
MRWSGLILAVLTLASNFHPSEALRIVQFPPNPQVGRTVFLHVEDAQFPIQCDWFRGNGVNRNRQILKTEYNQVTARGPAYTGREDLWRGCALKIQNVQASDSGPYTLSMLELRGSEFITAVGHLQVSS